MIFREQDFFKLRAFLLTHPVEELIGHITSPPIMAYPDFNLPYIVHTDASENALGAVLYQQQGDQMRVISYASRTLIQSEKNYHMHSGKLEFLALKCAITDQFRDHYPYFVEKRLVYNALFDQKFKDTSAMNIFIIDRCTLLHI